MAPFLPTVVDLWNMAYWVGAVLAVGLLLGAIVGLLEYALWYSMTRWTALDQTVVTIRHPKRVVSIQERRRGQHERIRRQR
jgi:hypothetical protein